MKTFADKRNSGQGNSRKKLTPEMPCHAQPARNQQGVRQILRCQNVQTKLVVGAPDDVFEQEADRVAEQVVGMPAGAVFSEPIGRGDDAIRTRLEEEGEAEPTVDELPEDEEEKLVSLKTVEGGAVPLSDDLDGRVRALQEGGVPLGEEERAFFEPRFGADFSRVRIHTDSAAQEAAGALNAQAFTLGSDVTFGAGRYAPGTEEGVRLMAHELAQVLQQERSGQSPSLQGMFVQREEARGTETATTASGPRRLHIPSVSEMLYADERQRRLRRVRAMAERHLLSRATVEVVEPGRPATCGEVMDDDFRRELRSVMSESDITRIAAQPVFTVEEFMGQVEVLGIGLLDGPETEEEMCERIAEDIRSLATGPRRETEAAPPSFTLIDLPEWLSLYNDGKVGFHVTLGPGGESPLAARLTTQFRGRGLPVSSELLNQLLHNYESGCASLEALLRELLPTELRSDVPGIAAYIAGEIMDAALEAHVQREQPGPAERWAERDERIRQAFCGAESRELGPIQEFIDGLGAGVTLTVRFE